MKRKKINKTAVGLSLFLTLGGITLNQTAGTPIDAASAFHRLGIPLVRLIFFIFIGLAAGQAIETLGWTRQAAVVARPFFKFSNLGNRCGAAFTAAFLSGVTANAMLLDYYQENHISKVQLFLSNYVNQLPAFFLHLPTTLFIILPLTGAAGLLYLGLTFLATLVRTFIFFVCGHLFLPDPGNQADPKPETLHEQPHNWSDLFQKIKTRLPRRITNIIIWVLPIYTIVFLLNFNGFFDFLNNRLAHSVSFNLIPIESLSVVILSFAAEFTSGFAAAGALMDAGVLNVKQTVIALLIGNVLAFPVRALRHQLPRYMGIFSPKMGLQLLLSGQLFRILSIVFVGTLYYMVA